MKKWLSTIFLLLTAVTAFASSDTDSHGLITSFTSGVDSIKNGTDMSINYLGQIFGDIGAGIVPGLGGNLFGTLMHYFNLGIIVCVGCFILYTVFHLSFKWVLQHDARTSSETFMAVVKVCMATCCLIPYSNGYSVLQQTMAEVVVQGVGLADMIWDYTLDYFSAGGLIYYPPEDTSVSSGDTSSGGDTNSVMTTDEASNLLAKDYTDGDLKTETDYSPVQQLMVSYACMWDHERTEGASLDPKVTTSDDGGTVYIKFPNRSGGSATSSTGCGSYTLNNDTSGTTSTPSTDPVAGGILLQAANSLLSDITPVAIDAYCSEQTNLGKSAHGYSCPKSPKDNVSDNQAILQGATLDYLLYMQQLSQYMALHVGDDTDSTSDAADASADDSGVGQADLAMLKMARENGWMSIGAFMWDLSELSFLKSTTTSDPYKCGVLGKCTTTTTTTSAAQGVSTMVLPTCTDTGCGTRASGASTNEADTSDQAINIVNKVYCYTQTEKWGTADAGSECNILLSTGTTSYADTSVVGKVDTTNDADQDGSATSGTSTNSTFTENGDNTVAQARLAMKKAVGSVWSFFSNFLGSGVSYAYKNILGDFKTIDKSYAFQPIAVLYTIGNHCLTAAVALWLLPLPYLLGILLATMACQGEFNLSAWIEPLMDLVKPILIALSMPLLAAGFFLAYWIPFYPFLVTTFAIVGWILMVIETLVATPLVCLGLTHPSGNDMTSEVKQAVMLTLSVFLRPALLVIGGLMSILVMDVSYRFVLQCFGQFVFDLFQYPLRGDATQYATSVGGGAANIYDGVVHAASALYPPGTENMKLHSTGGAYTHVNNGIKSIMVVPIMLVIFTMTCVSVCKQAAGLITGLADYVTRWIGAPSTSPIGGSATDLAGGIEGSAKAAGKASGEVGKAKIDLFSDSTLGATKAIDTSASGGGGDMQGGAN